MDVIPSSASVIWQSAIAYLDHIVVISKTVEQPLKHHQRDLTLLRYAGVTLNFKTCSFFVETINYLGHVVRPGKLEMVESTTDAIRQLQDPTTQTEIRYFRRLCSVFRWFVPNFSRVAAPLNKTLCKEQPKSFPSLTVEEKQAVERLKNLITNPSVLALPWVTGHYTVDTDSCDKHIGCVVLQEQLNGPEIPIGYCSRTLNNKGRELAARHCECLSVVWAVLFLHSYLVVSRCTVRTDHEALQRQLTISNASKKRVRWILQLSEVECDIVHRACIKHQARDAMSRLPKDRNDKTKLDDDIPVLAIRASTADTDKAEQERESRENYEEPTKQEFNPYLPELNSLADQNDETKHQYSGLTRIH